VKSDCVGARYNSTRDDVVTIKERTSDRLTDAVDVHRGSSDEGNDETGGCSQKSRDHQGTEPTDIETVVG